MEDVNIISPQQLTSVLPARQIDKSELEDASQAKKIQTAKDFESLLLNKLLDQMKNTVGEWGFEKEGVSSQVDGIFWLYLARDISDQGGLGLWKDIYKSMPGTEDVQQAGKSLDGHS